MDEISRYNEEQARLESEFAHAMRKAFEETWESGFAVDGDEREHHELPASGSGCSFEMVGDRGVAVTQVVDDPYAKPEFDTHPFSKAVLAILNEAGLAKAQISVALVDDAKIHELNRQFLGHDYPTDVITFPLGEEAGCFHGEIVVSVDTAKTTSARLGWPPEHELLLYVMHGALHLVGYDDQDPDSVIAMRAAERRHLANFGLTPPEDPRDG